MSCREIQEKFSKFFDDLMIGKKREEFIAHLEDCEKCRTAWCRFKCICSCLRQLPSASPPEDVLEGVMIRVEELEHSRTWWQKIFVTRRLNPLYVGAFACALLVFVFFWTQRGIFKSEKQPGNYPGTIAMEGKTGARSALMGQPRMEGTFKPNLLSKQAGFPTITIYVDNVEQAERKIASLVSRVSPGTSYGNVKEYAGRKVLSQFRLKIPVYQYDFMIRQLNKIGSVRSKEYKGEKIREGSIALEKSAGSRTALSHQIPKRTTANFATTQGMRRKMGQGYRPESPVVPVAVVVVSHTSD